MTLNDDDDITDTHTIYTVYLMLDIITYQNTKHPESTIISVN